MSGKTIFDSIADFISYAQCNLYLKQEDGLFAYNRVLTCLKTEDAVPCDLPDPDKFSKTRPDEVLAPLVDYATQKGIVSAEERDFFECELIACVIPNPSFFNEVFDLTASEYGISAACDFFYSFCIKSNYIKSRDLYENINWEAQGSKGPLKISINAARPEMGGTADYNYSYPKCPLCKENIGYGFNKGNPRQTLRYINIFLGGEDWLLQYSPFSYYNEHCNIISAQHTPMKIDEGCFSKLLEFLDIAPQYFVGSNSELPRVGASNPSHNHYQGGGTRLPLFDAQSKLRLSHPAYPHVRIDYLDWYTSCVRLSGRSPSEIAALAAHIYGQWTKFSEPKLEILAGTNSEPHNSVTPLAYINGDGEYVLDIVFRNNRADETHPYGIFAQSADLSCIKSSPLGMLEVAGFFVLPARLATDGEKIRELLSGKNKLDFETITAVSHPLHIYLPMIAQLACDCGTGCGEEKAAEAIEGFINKSCERMLGQSAVFKDTAEGMKGFNKFAKKAGMVVSDS